MIRIMLITFSYIIFGSCTNNDQKVDTALLVQKEDIKLVAPKLKDNNFFFKDNTLISFYETFANSKVFYKVNNAKYKQYNGPFVISKSSQLSYFCADSDFINSDTISQNYFNTVNFKRFKIEGSEPSEPYLNKGLSALNNIAKADFQFKDEEWIAFKDSVVKFELTVQDIVSQKGTIGFSFLNMQSSWIFKPQKISVEAVNDEGEVFSKQQQVIDSKSISTDGFFYTTIQLEKLSLIYKIEIEQLDSLPSWHPGHGGQPWLFMDEIIVF